MFNFRKVVVQVDICESWLADYRHLLIQCIHLVIGLQQDKADDDQDDDGEDQGSEVLSLHEKVHLVCGTKSIGHEPEDQGIAMDNTFSGSGQKFFNFLSH